MRAATILSVQLSHLHCVPSSCKSLHNRHVHLLSLRPHSHTGFEIGRRTLGILAPADFDELLNVGNFGRHLDGNVSTSRWKDREVRETASWAANCCGERFSLGCTGCHGAECRRCYIRLGGVTTCVA